MSARPIFRASFDSMADAYRAAIRPGIPQRFMEEGSQDFYGIRGESLKRAALTGDTENADRVAAMFDKIQADLGATDHAVWTPAPFGGVACVPDFLAGEPDCMRARIQRADESNPVRIIANAAHRWDVKHEHIIARGAAIAALAVNLAAVRPVRLSVVCTYGAHYGGPGRNWTHDKAVAVLSIDIDTRAADLSTLAFALVNPAALRRIMFTHALDVLRVPENEARNESLPLVSDEDAEAMTREDPTDLYLPVLRGKNPFPANLAHEWVREHLDRLTADQ